MSADVWHDEFFGRLAESTHAGALREAAINRRLGEWTGHLTRAVVDSCGRLGWQAAARRHDGPLPVKRGEYLALDVTAFPAEHQSSWPLPHAIFELENSPRDEYVIYALWKVMCVRAKLRVLFAYRAEASTAVALVSKLGTEVIGTWPLEDRVHTSGETLVVMGHRGEAETFPHGFFRTWILNCNTARFERLH